MNFFIDSIFSGKTWILIILLLWDGIWKIIALWNSARKKKLIWFIAIAVLNTVGFLPITYLLFFNKKNKDKK